MNGEILAKSRIGEASSFIFTVPFDIKNIEDISKKEEKSGISKAIHAYKILVAEDDDVNQVLIGELLKKKGWLYNIVSDGKEVLDSLLADEYDLILMDGQMPELDGFETTKIIREKEKKEELKRMPIIALSAYALKEDRDKFMSTGVDDFISKPIRYFELFDKIEKLLNSGEKNNV